MTLAKTDALKEKLTAGVRGLGLELSDTQHTQLLAYLALLQKWNGVYNLTAVRDPEQMVTQHLLDCLAVVPAFREIGSVLDVGSGGGLPGIVLAIVYPDMAVWLIDTVQKKTAFLTQAKMELGLRNVTVLSGRVENSLIDKKFDAITSRAFSELKDLIRLSGHLLREDGQIIAMKGLLPQTEIAALPPEWAVVSTMPVHVPGLNADRHIIVIKKKSA